jgi:hypothetical protein
MSDCDCGQPATVPVVVHWADGDRTYDYCPSCALDICAFVGGTEPDPVWVAGLATPTGDNDG